MSTSPDLTKFVLGHLRIIQAQVDMAIAMLEGPAPEGCQHPPEKRADVSVMDGSGPRWKCTVCDQEFEGEA